MLMNKVVDGKEVEMGGILEYTVNADATSLTSELTFHGNHMLWSFTRHGNAMRGTLKPPADQNLSEMAQRLEAALRRPGKSEDARAAPPAPKAAGEPAAAETEAFTPPPPSHRLDTVLRRPLETDDIRAVATAPKTPSEPAAPATDEARAATPADPSRPAARTDAKPAPQKSFYESLEQEMAGLLNRPPKP